MARKKKSSLDANITKAVAKVPDGIKKFSKDKTFNRLEAILPGDQFSSVRSNLRSHGIAEWTEGGKIAADFDSKGNVVAIAAAVSRTPQDSEDWLRDNVPDFDTFSNQNINDFGVRQQRLQLFHQVTRSEGMVNNAIKKTASLIAQDGSFKIRFVKQGKRPAKAVEDELKKILVFWQENVNSSDEEGTITGSRGLKQIVRRGARQSMIEGDLFMRQLWEKTDVPILGKSYSLPMLMQAIPSQDIYIPKQTGVGAELLYWRPSNTVIQNLTAKETNIRKVVQKSLSPKVINELKKTGMYLLDPSLVTHIKHGGTDTDVFGQSAVEPAMTDLAYGRALKMLDFVTISALVNRMLIIKIGDPNKESDYHNLSVAQSRVNVFRKLITGQVGPNMMIVWAGHDIEKLDVGAHDQILNTDGRHEIAKEGLKVSLGVPDSVLMGSVEGGARGAGWLGFIALSTVAEELKEEFAQVITQLGTRIAMENNFDDVDLIWEFNKTLLADKEANSKVMLQAYDRGLLSRRSMIEELDKDFDAEKVRKQIEEEEGDDELFEPPMPVQLKGGPGGLQGSDPKSRPGRPTNKDNPEPKGSPNPKPIKPSKDD
jgi:hypothetical protein